MNSTDAQVKRHSTFRVVALFVIFLIYGTTCFLVAAMWIRSDNYPGAVTPGIFGALYALFTLGCFGELLRRMPNREPGLIDRAFAPLHRLSDKRQATIQLLIGASLFIGGFLGFVGITALWVGPIGMIFYAVVGVLGAGILVHFFGFDELPRSNKHWSGP